MTGQRQDSVAIGRFSGFTGQGTGAIAIGYQAGMTGQGTGSICIGYNASLSNQVSNSIIINSSGIPITGTNAGLYIAPVRNATGYSTLYYNTDTDEVTSGSTGYFSSVLFTNSNVSGLTQTALSTYTEEQLSIIWYTDTTPSATASTNVYFTRYGRTVTATITSSLIVSGGPVTGFPQTVSGTIPARYAITTGSQSIPVPVDRGNGTRPIGCIIMNATPTWFLYCDGGSVGFTGTVNVFPNPISFTYNIY
jgi:hypothetical protein